MVHKHFSDWRLRLLNPGFRFRSLKTEKTEDEAKNQANQFALSIYWRTIPGVLRYLSALTPDDVFQEAWIAAYKSFSSPSWSKHQSVGGVIHYASLLARRQVLTVEKECPATLLQDLSIVGRTTKSFGQRASSYNWYDVWKETKLSLHKFCYAMSALENQTPWLSNDVGYKTAFDIVNYETTTHETPEDIAGKRQQIRLVREKLDELKGDDSRNCDIVLQRFTTDDSLEVVGDKWGLSRERVRQIEREFLQRLRDSLHWRRVPEAPELEKVQEPPRRPSARIVSIHSALSSQKDLRELFNIRQLSIDKVCCDLSRLQGCPIILSLDILWDKISMMIHRHGADGPPWRQTIPIQDCDPEGVIDVVRQILEWVRVEYLQWTHRRSTAPPRIWIREEDWDDVMGWTIEDFGDSVQAEPQLNQEKHVMKDQRASGRNLAASAAPTQSRRNPLRKPSSVVTAALEKPPETTKESPNELTRITFSPQDWGVLVRLLDGYKGATAREIRHDKARQYAKQIDRIAECQVVHLLEPMNQDYYYVLDGGHRLTGAFEIAKVTREWICIIHKDYPGLDVVQLVRDLNENSRHTIADLLKETSSISPWPEVFDSVGLNPPYRGTSASQPNWAAILSGYGTYLYMKARGRIATSGSTANVTPLWLSTPRHDIELVAATVLWWETGANVAYHRKPPIKVMRSYQSIGFALSVFEQNQQVPTLSGFPEKIARTHALTDDTGKSGGQVLQLYGHYLLYGNYKATRHLIRLFGRDGRDGLL